VNGSVPVPVALVPFAVGAFVAWRQRAWDLMRIGALALVGLAAGVGSIARISGDVQPYLYRWTWVLGAAVWIVVLWAAARWALNR
jgi:hypothetical protein